jgi:hypothetical protein
VGRVAYLLGAGSCTVNVKQVRKTKSVGLIGEYALTKRASANIAVADEKYFYHSYVLLLFAGKCPVLQGVPAVLCFALKCIIVANQSRI